MASQTDTLLLEILADVRDLKAGLDLGEGEVRKFSKKTTGHLQQIKTILGPIGATLAATFGARAITNFTLRTIQLNDQLAKTADKLGVDTTLLQEYQYMAERTGVSKETLNMALQRFVRRAAEARQGTGEAVGALREMGIQLTDNHGNLRSTDALLKDVADAMAGQTNQADRVRLAMKLFDSEGVALVNTLQGGSSAIEEMQQHLHEMGGVIEEETLRQAEDLQDTITDLQTTLRATGSEIVDAFAPAITGLANAVSWLAEKYRQLREGLLLDEDAMAGMAGASAEAEEAERRRVEALRQSKAETEAKAAEEAEAARTAQMVAEAMAAVSSSLGEVTPRVKKYSEMVEEARKKHEELMAEFDFSAFERVAEEGEAAANIFDESLNDQARSLEIFTSSASMAWDQMWSSFANSSLTGKARIEAIQNALLQGLLRMLGEMVKQWAITEAAKTGLSIAGNTARIAGNEAETASNLRTAGSDMVGAVAKLIKSEAAKGIIGLVIAAAGIAIMYGMFQSAKSAFGFDQGGVIEKGQTGFFEGRRREVIAPEVNFLDYIRGLYRGGGPLADMAGASAGGGDVYNVYLAEKIEALDPVGMDRVFRDELAPRFDNMLTRRGFKLVRASR